MRSPRLIPRCLAALLCLAALAGCARVPEGQMTVTFFDVGKGDCILIRTASSAVLIDAGYKDTADGVIAALRALGVTRLDALVVTHYDKDHVGGAAAVADAFPIGVLYLPDYEGTSRHAAALAEAIERRGLDARRVTEDVSFSLGGASFTICAAGVAYEIPAGGGEANDNDVSLVTAVRHGQDSYLFAGDLEEAGIAAWLARDAGTFGVLKVPHHGKAEANSEALIAAVRPRVAVVTDSADDPASDNVLTLLTAAGADVRRTAVDGTVTISSGGDGRYTVS